MQRRTFLTGLGAAALALRTDHLLACSRVFVNDRAIAKIVTRSMDLPLAFPERPKFFVFPRGMARSSESAVVPGVKARVEGTEGKPMRWMSKFGSATMVSFGGAASDGLNEKGLAAHVLVLAESQHEPRDGRTELPDTHWVQYVLDSFATVKEVVDVHKSGLFRLVAGWSGDLGYPKPLGLHLAVDHRARGRQARDPPRSRIPGNDERSEPG